jgi:hypothetical protein
MVPQCHHAKTSDGVSIAYWAVGIQTPLVLAFSSRGSHVDVALSILAILSRRLRERRERLLS